MTRARIAAAFAVLALAGCGGTAASSSTASPPAAASVARHLGCTGISPVNPPTDFAHSEVDATCQGHHADIATFKTDQLRDEWASFVRQTGGTVQTGELYAVTAPATSRRASSRRRRSALQSATSSCPISHGRIPNSRAKRTRYRCRSQVCQPGPTAR